MIDDRLTVDFRPELASAPVERWENVSRRNHRPTTTETLWLSTARYVSMGRNPFALLSPATFQ
jgi:hypothetical protein